jgi:SAM-dependent methyltransferase
MRTSQIYDPILDGLIGQGTVLLDLGCSGRSESPLNKYGDRAVGIGVDIDPELHKQKLPVKVLADAHRLPFRNGVFDLISSRHVLEHIENPPQFFRETVRVLREGGRLLLLTNNLYNPAVAFAKLLPHKWHRSFLLHFLRFHRGYDNAPVFYRANTRWSLDQHCEAAGFSSCKITHASGMYAYFKGLPVISRAVFEVGNLLTDNRLLAVLKLNLILLAIRTGSGELEAND